MRNNKRGSTLVMVLCVFAFVIIIGTSVVMLAGVANKQATRAYARQQADFAAQSVLDAVCSQISDGTIDPFVLGQGPENKIEGSGSDDVLGDYSILIERYEKDDAENVFRVLVDVSKGEYPSSIYRLMQYTQGSSEEIDLGRLFDVTAGATNANKMAEYFPSAVENSKITGSIFFDNAEMTTALSGDPGVTENIDVIGNLSIENGSYGTDGNDNHINVSKDVEIKTDGMVYAEIHSEGNVLVERSPNVAQSVYANANITIAQGAQVNGDLHAGGNVEILTGAVVRGNVYANGAVTVEDGTVEDGSIYAQDDVLVKNGKVADMIRSNGTVALDQGEAGSIECDGDVQVNGAVTLGIRTNGNCDVQGSVGEAIEAGGNVTLKNMTLMGDVSAGGTLEAEGIDASVSFSSEQDMTLTDCTLQGSLLRTNGVLRAARLTLKLADSQIVATAGLELDESALEGAAVSGGDASLNRTQMAGDPAAPVTMLSVYGNLVMQDHSAVDQANILCNKDVSISGNSVFAGKIDAGGNFAMQSGNGTGDVLAGGNATVDSAQITGNVTAKGNGLFKGGKGMQNVTGTITLGGTLDPDTSPDLANTVVIVDPETIPAIVPLPEVKQEITVQPVQEMELPEKMPVVTLDLQKKYEAIPAWNIPAFVKKQMEQMEITLSFADTENPDYAVEGNDYIISKNCALTLDFTGGQSYGKQIVLDATKEDLYIRLKAAKTDSNYTVQIPNGVQLLSKGDHNVFVFLDEGTGKNDQTNLALTSNHFVGYYDYVQTGLPAENPRVPNLFFVSNAKDVMVDCSRLSSVHAFIYAPYGSVNITGSADPAYGGKLFGSVIASRVQMGGANSYVYFKPDVVVGGETEISGWTEIGTYYVSDGDES